MIYIRKFREKKEQKRAENRKKLLVPFPCLFAVVQKVAGANSIFAGDKLLTTPNPDFNDDKEMFDLLGLQPREAFKYVVEQVSTLSRTRRQTEVFEWFQLQNMLVVTRTE